MRGPAEFWLRLAAIRPKAITDDMLAFTELDDRSGDGIAGIYYPTVVALAAPGRPELPAILGAAIVHEIGHLILGANAHSEGGVMTAHWGHAQFQQIGESSLTFNAGQARRIRSELLRRQQSERAASGTPRRGTAYPKRDVHVRYSDRRLRGQARLY